MLGLPGRELVVGDLGDLTEQVDRAEQDIAVRRSEHDGSFLGGDERVFQGVSDPDGGIDADDPRRPLE